MLQPARSKYRKAHKGRIHGACHQRQHPDLRLLWPQGDRARPRHRAPDRGGAPRHHPPHPPHRPRLDPHLPGRAGVGEAGRGAHGQRQGQRPNSGSAASSRAASCSSSTACRGNWRAKHSTWRPRSCRSARASSPVSASRSRRHEGRRRPRQDRRRTEDELETLGKEAFNLRFQRATGQLENTSRVRQVRRDIARIKTILGERARKAS